MPNWLLLIQVALYDLVVGAYFLGIKIAGLWDEKARKWSVGRVGVFEKVYAKISAQRLDNQKLVWMHCASLGEFEQGRPVLEAIRKKHPTFQILLTFFSPSGYEIRKDHPIANWVAYLPADTAANASKFLKMVRPDLAIFVKYEFWYHYLASLFNHEIPVLLISSVFREQQPFFKWYGGLHRRMLRCFDQVLVQDARSLELLKNIGIENASIAGDTRVDRVSALASNPQKLPLLEEFCQNYKVLVCGSTWPADEAILYPIFSDPKYSDWKFILAPHDVQPAHLQAIASKLKLPFTWYSNLGSIPDLNRLLVVDNIGLLSSIYQFGDIAYIGGGFGQGIHNTLEPAAYGLPIIFGPKYQKFEEAKWLVKHGGAIAVQNEQELQKAFYHLCDDEARMGAGRVAKVYIESNTGGTANVLMLVEDYLFKICN
jgi:3-deoxy-D-manno-octulosonic-acid transferase